MSQTIQILDNSKVREVFSSQHGRNYTNGNISLTLQSYLLAEHIPLRSPYSIADARITRVVSGCTHYRINLIDYTLNAGDVVLIPAGAIVELINYSDDYTVQALAFSEESVANSVIDVTYLDLDKQAAIRLEHYFDLIALQMQRERYLNQSVAYLIKSLLADLLSLPQSIAQRPSTRNENIFGKFVGLLREHGSTCRSIQFYAERINITPNHLSAVIRKHTGRTVMEWIDRTTITQAKVLLKNSDLMVYEIAERLCFREATAFNRYFKKHTGLTPIAYRKG